MAANQSRRRVMESTDKPEYLDQAETFHYQELSGDVDSLRLLTIEPADKLDDVIICRMRVVEFGERPKYEALSYMWGSEENQSSIVVNGCDLLVRQNLLEALRYLRSRAYISSIWIDALCINQRDIQERNRQLRIMHHIYFRASAVVVWLGTAYTEYQDLFPRLRARMVATKSPKVETAANLDVKKDAQTNDLAEEKRFVEVLSEDGYWQRLWIIQEVGHAEWLFVCFGSHQPMPWNDFIHLMRMHNVGHNGPLRLDQLRRNTGEGALTFPILLDNHQRAICSKWHDKIYGLVGLAADAHGFPMDYTKSPIQVWKDVMHFVHERRLVSDADMIKFGVLVKGLIFQNDGTPLMQILQSDAGYDHRPEAEKSESHPPFKMHGSVLGQIVHVGATTTAIINQLRTVDAWNQKVQENFRDFVEEAHKENRELQRAILRPANPRECYNHVSSVRWRTRIHCTDGLVRSPQEVNRALQLYEPRFKDHMTLTRSDTASTDPSLYQLSPRTVGAYAETLWRMGIVSYQAEEGDLIVCLRDVRQAMLIRCHRELDPRGFVCSQIIGTAWATADLATELDEHFSRVDSLSRLGETMPVEMDADTMFVMLSSVG